MPPPATIGHPPESRNDFFIARYSLARFLPDHRPLTQIRPVEGIAAHVNTENINPLESRSEWLVGSCITLAIIMALSTILRIVVRLRARGCKLSSLTSDDWTILPSAIFSMIFNLSICYVTGRGGFGKHFWTITYDQWRIGQAYSTLIYASFSLATAFVKVSVVCYLRIAIGNWLPAFRLVSNIFLSILTIYITTSVCIWLFLCGSPRDQVDIIWTAQQDRPLKCINVMLVNFILTAIHVVFDLILFGAAAYLYYRVRSAWTRKVALLFLFSLGGTSCLFSIIRLVTQRASHDITWDLVPVLLWAMLDQTSAMLVANLPIIYTYLYDLKQQYMEQRVVRAQRKDEQRRVDWNKALYDRRESLITKNPQDFPQQEAHEDWGNKQRTSTFSMSELMQEIKEHPSVSEVQVFPPQELKPPPPKSRRFWK